MKRRPEEEWARSIISQALGVPVEQHDDGSKPSMHDLVIRYPDRDPGAVEITAAAHPDSIQLWKLMNVDRGRWLVEGLRGGWLVFVLPSARLKRLLVELPALLASLEAAGVNDLEPDLDPDMPWSRVAADLGVASARQSSDTDFPGSVYLSIEEPLERSAGFVSVTGDELSSWVGDFLSTPKQADVLGKLGQSGAEERHAFLLVPSFSIAPFAVTHLLMSDDPPIPTVSPALPREVTHVWVVSTWSAGMVFHWSPASTWLTFAKATPG